MKRKIPAHLRGRVTVVSDPIPVDLRKHVTASKHPDGPAKLEVLPWAPSGVARQPSGKRRGEMNKLEAEYAQHLDLLQAAGEIITWAYEPKALKIPSGSYTPDFLVIRLIKDQITHWGTVQICKRLACEVECHELKGKPIAHSQVQASRVRFRVAQETFPGITFRWITRTKYGWSEKIDRRKNRKEKP